MMRHKHCIRCGAKCVRTEKVWNGKRVAEYSCPRSSSHGVQHREELDAAEAAKPDTAVPVTGYIGEAAPDGSTPKITDQVFEEREKARKAGLLAEPGRDDVRELATQQKEEGAGAQVVPLRGEQVAPGLKGEPGPDDVRTLAPQKQPETEEAGQQNALENTEAKE